MKVTELFESPKLPAAGGTFGALYSEKLAMRLPFGLKTDDAILDAAYKSAKEKKDYSIKRLDNLFQSEDFPSDLVSAYNWWQKNYSSVLDTKANGADDVVVNGVRYERSGPRNSVSKPGKWKLAEGTGSIAEGAFVIKSKDGVQKRFKNADSPEAIEWKNKVARPPKVKAERFTDEWWHKSASIVIPRSRIGQYDLFHGGLEKQLKDHFVSSAINDFYIVDRGFTNRDGTTCATAIVRVVYEFDMKDMGYDDKTIAQSGNENGLGLESVTIKVARNRENPKKIDFLAYI